jgi:pimeloyl-ACP methyl ester carboxylesterase
MNSTLAQTNHGLVEYTWRGEGEPILVLHGGHSNCFEEFGYQPLLARGFSLLTPSRPGYGRTPLGADGSAQATAQLMVSLLDHLNLTAVHLLGFSAGGPTALALAAYFPERTKRLVLESAVTQTWLTPEDETYRRAQRLFHPRLQAVSWALMRGLTALAPRMVTKMMFEELSSAPYRAEAITPEQVDEIRRMIRRQSSGAGFLNDLEQRVEPESLRLIQAPTLILHSRNDHSVPLEHAYQADKLIANTTLHLLDNDWGHLIWLDRLDEVTDQVASFLNDSEQN